MNVYTPFLSICFLLFKQGNSDQCVVGIKLISEIVAEMGVVCACEMWYICKLDVLGYC